MDTIIKTWLQKAFLQAAGHDRMLPLYDSLTKLIGADRARITAASANPVQTEQWVLDIGCGTETLAILVRRRNPHADIVGLDPI